MPTVTLGADQLEMLRRAIDSHIYWQLPDPLYRRNGGIVAPGSDVAEEAAEIEAFYALDAAIATAGIGQGP